MLKDSDKKVIAFTGSHGTGKSKLALNYASNLKNEFPEYEIGYIHEIVQECPYSIIGKDTTSSELAQMWMFAAQIKKELDLVNKKFNIIVSDRSIIDYIAYSAALEYRDLVFSQMKFAKYYIKTYSNIFFVPIQDKIEIIDNGIRNLDLEFRKEVQNCIIDLFAQLKLPLKTI
ncbi:MAG: AAA family ATPase [Candidatus Caldatribacteriota bacterium]|jgi:nicotinamide riboside kinase|nr:ATP-binding protein [Patescibacteria group bacterium]